MTTRMIIVALVGAALCTAARGQDIDLMAAARVAVKAEWSDRLDDLDTMKTDEKIVLIEDLIEAARGTSRDARERFVMADMAVEIAIPLGTSQAESLARKAMILANSAQPYTDLLRTQREYDLGESRLEYMLDHRSEGGDVDATGTAAAEAAMEYALQLKQAGDLNECLTVTRSGIALADRYEVPDVADVCAELEKTLKVLRDREARLATARRELELAEAVGTPEAVRQARQKVGELLLGIDGDLLLAQPYLTGTSHALARAADALKKVQDSQQVSGPELLDAVVSVRDFVREDDSHTRETILSGGLTLCDAYDRLTQTDEEKMLGTLYRRALKRGAGHSQRDELVATLKKNYIHFNGDLLLLDGGRVRVTYDFSDADQLKDWKQDRLEWSVDRDQLRQTGGGSEGAQGTATNVVRFRADRPLTIRFDARAMDQIAFMGVYAPYGGDLGRDTCGFWFRDRENRRGGDRKEGLQMTTYRGTDRWTDTRRLQPDADYSMKAVFDGAGRVEWWINDSLVHEYIPLETDAVFTDGSISVQLVARTATTRQPTIYDDVVIEGELLSAPKERPAD